MAENATGQKMRSRYLKENRSGDHICYYSDLRKIRQHYPQWRVSKSLTVIFDEIAQGWLMPRSDVSFAK